MNKSMYAALGGLAGFAVGAGLFLFRGEPARLPSAPPGVLAEFEGGAGPQPVRVSISPQNVRRLEKEMSVIEQDQRAFRASFHQLNESFRTRLDELLTPEQKKKLEATRHQAPVKSQLALPPGGPPQSGDVLRRSPTKIDGVAPAVDHVLPMEVLDSMVELTFVSWATENLEVELALSPDQRTAVRALLEERRGRFLEMVDRTPPPSLRLMRLTKADGDSR